MVELDTPPSQAFDDAQALANDIADLFDLQDWTLDRPFPKHIRFRGVFLGDLADTFGELRRRFERYGYTPMVRDTDHGVMLIAAPVTFERNTPNYALAALLFMATIVTTLYVGALSSPAFTGRDWVREIWLGWPFSLSILLILGAHELGHFFAARYHRVAVSPPYFIPFPSLLGTMGAFIAMKEPAANKRQLLDIGAAGPLCGLVFAIPILVIGLLTSDVGPSPAGGYLLEGNSLLYAGIKTLVFGRFLPDGFVDVQLNQVAWAGWAGLLVTGLNLLPVGQLDGGHMAYVLFGGKARLLYIPVLLSLGGLAVLGGNGASMWWVWILLLLFFGRHYAQPLDDVTPLDARRRFIAVLTFLLFVVVFVPIPLTLVN